MTARYLVIEWDSEAAHEDVLKSFEDALVPRAAAGWDAKARDAYLVRRAEAYASAEGRTCVDPLDKLLLVAPEPADCVILLKGGVRYLLSDSSH